MWELSLTYAIQPWLWGPGIVTQTGWWSVRGILDIPSSCCSLVQDHTAAPVGTNRARGIFILTLACTLFWGHYCNPSSLNYHPLNVRNRPTAFSLVMTYPPLWPHYCLKKRLLCKNEVPMDLLTTSTSCTSHIISTVINNMVSQLLQHVHLHFNLFIVLPAFSFHQLSQEFPQQWVFAVNTQMFMLKPHGDNFFRNPDCRCKSENVPLWWCLSAVSSVSTAVSRLTQQVGTA